jgi:hypothetical protein
MTSTICIKPNPNKTQLNQLRNTKVLTDYYHKIAHYLTDTFGANFIFLIILLTTGVSIVYFIIISYIITQMDKEYFLYKNGGDNQITDDVHIKKSYLSSKNSGIRYLVNIAKIIIGVFLLVCGIVMLVLPGQGLITMLIGLSLIPFPGKHKLEQNLLGRKSVRSSLNWIRAKANKDPFIFD